MKGHLLAISLVASEGGDEITEHLTVGRYLPADKLFLVVENHLSESHDASSVDKGVEHLFSGLLYGVVEICVVPSPILDCRAMNFQYLRHVCQVSTRGCQSLSESL